MDYSTRFQQLATDLSFAGLKGSGVDVKYFSFCSITQAESRSCIGSFVANDSIMENQQFTYPVFYPVIKERQQEAILLLHGLNERSWNKYYPWAEYLCRATGKAVVLFPIAYHVNRSPQTWSNPRVLQGLLEHRKQLTGNHRSLSFANLALSERLSERPLRFFTSGRQSFHDVEQLCKAIQQGDHPMFESGSSVDVFAYSIGAFLAQILFLSNPGNVFAKSRLFMFCGGGIFSSMYGCSRSIMDAASYERLYTYYLQEFKLEDAEQKAGSELARTFFSMIAPFHLKEKRLQLFQAMKDRVRGISLADDKVIPYEGVQKAMGDDLARQTVELIDLPYNYTHENPFPVGGAKTKEVDAAFLKIFKSASGFLA
jgi:hypothetical protein